VLDVKRSSESITSFDRFRKNERGRKKENFARLCQVKKFGSDEHLECLEKNPSHCPFAVSFINRHICICQMRMHIIQKLKK